MRDPSQTESNVMHENPKLTIAIDGPSGSGKSSVSKEVARHFGLAYLDTGAMYRAATYRVLQLDIDLADQDAIGKAVQEMPLVFGTNIKEEEILRQLVQKAEVDYAEIEHERISGAVSAVASVPAVREYLIELQRWTINQAVNGIVAEGRDITTVVAPDADARILLTASEEVRMARRGLENTEKSGESGDLTQQISERDTQDSKVNNFMEAAPGVTLVDSSDLDFNETVSAVINAVNAQVKAKRQASRDASAGTETA